MVTIWICFLVCVFSTALGAVSGIGGGVLIKPMLDLTLSLPMAQISLLSSFAVLCMSLFSVGKNYLQKNRQIIRMPIAVPLAIGSTAGGVLGKLLFNQLSLLLHAGQAVKMIQNGLLFLLMLGVLISSLAKRREAAPVERSFQAGLGLSFGLGVLAAFLGIGGGPLNILVLTLFYGMTHKEGVLYSLFIIIFSQLAGIVTALASSPAALPEAGILLAACSAGILGGVLGRGVAKRFSNRVVRGLYLAALGLILAVCTVNMAAVMGAI